MRAITPQERASIIQRKAQQFSCRKHGSPDAWPAFVSVASQYVSSWGTTDWLHREIFGRNSV